MRRTIKHEDSAQQQAVPSSTTSSLPGARESNAGDDFHFLWAVRSALQLLKPNTEFVGISIEGVSSGEATSVADESLLLGIDLAEYYGACDIRKASRVVYSQLKYSTRHPTTEWTLARLAARRSSNSNDSVARRLASAAVAALKLVEADGVRRKLTIRLVSNQPASAELVGALTAAQQVLSQKPITTTHRLLQELPEPVRDQIKKLSEAADVASRAFVVFLSVLDLSQCGVASRALLRVNTLRTLGASSIGPADDLYKLYDLVRELASPGHNGRVIGRHDVLAALGIGDGSSLFPAPPKLHAPEPSIATEDGRRVADFVLTHLGQQVVAHGAAGIGKTTTLLQLRDYLPPGSEVVPYDCYGGGDYLNLGQERHRPRECFLQICNELAVRTGTPLVLNPRDDPVDGGRLLGKRLQAAAEALGTKAILAIVVDAADNAAIAGQQTGGQSFLPHLRRLALPPNCCVVYSSRTHRKHLVDPDSSLDALELEGFSRRETASYTAAQISAADDPLWDEVHRLSQGVPRFQAYLLSQLSPAKTSTELLRELHQLAPRALEDVFEGIVTRAGAELAGAAAGHRIEGTLSALVQAETDKLALANLVYLARPITIEQYAEFSGLNAKLAEQYCRALRPGVTIEGREISFRDEAFETFLRSKFDDAEQSAAWERLAAEMLARCGDSAYAATHVADYLMAARRWDATVRLALHGPEPDSVSDEVTRLAVRRKRFAAGLTACAEKRDFESAAQLLARAAEAQRTSETIFEMVRKHPDLAALYGDVERLGAVYMREHEEALRSEEGHEPWLGAAHMRVAAMYSRVPELHDLAFEHLEAAWAWLRMRGRLPKHARQQWDISEADLASEVEAAFRLKGPDVAVPAMLRWRPQEFVRRATRRAVHQLRETLDEAAAEALMVAAEAALHPRYRTWASAYLAACLWAEGARLTPVTLGRLAEQCERAVSANRLPEFESVGYGDSWSVTGWCATFAEALTTSGVARERIVKILMALAPATPHYAPSGPDLGRWDAALRCRLLLGRLRDQEVTADDLEPDEWHKSRETSPEDPSVPSGTHPVNGRRVNDDERRRFREAVGVLIPAYALWAETATSLRSVTEIAERVRTVVRTPAHWSRHDIELFSFKWRCEVAWEAISHCSELEGAGRGLAVELLSTMAANAEQSGKVGTLGCWIKFSKLAVQSRATRNAGLELLERVRARVDTEPMPARDRWDILMQCARIALPHAPELCQDLYRRGIEAAQDVDDESIPFVSALCSLSHSLAGSGNEERRAALASSLVVIAEEYRLRFSDESRTPWDEALQAVTALDVRSGLAASYRWDHKNIRQIDLSIPTVAAEGTRRGSLDPLAAVAVLAVARGDWRDRVERYGPDERFGAGVAYREALKALKSAGRSHADALEAALSEISERLLRDFSPGSRTRLIPESVRWADAQGLDGSPLEQLRKVAQFCESLPGVVRRGSYSSDPEWDAKWTAEQAERGRRLGKLVDRARTDGPEHLTERFNEAFQLDYDGGGSRYVRALAEHLPYGVRGTLIRALLALVPDRRGDVAMELAAELARKWHTNSEVRRAADEGVAELIQGHSRQVARHFDELVTLSSASPLDLVASFVGAVGADLGAWESGMLYLAFRHVSSCLSEPERWNAAEMGAQHLLEKARAGQLPGRDSAPDVTDPVAGFLFALCGHVDAHIRWDALHAFRFLVRAGRGDHLRAFVSYSHGTSAPPGFTHEEAPGMEFRWMTARVYSLLLLERLSDEVPAIVRSFAEALERHLFNESFPHAQIRELARRALLKLAAAFPADFTPDALMRIEFANRPTSCLLPRRSSYSREHPRVRWTHGGQVTDAGRRYQFDSLDVIPYWFEPAASVFHLGTDSFVAAAERWVVERWGVRGSEANAGWNWDEVHSRYPMGATDDRHGTLPRVESPATYLAFHAKQCVMGELVDSLPVSVEPYDDVPIQCPWEEWLSHYLPSSAGAWLADLRRSTPLETELWEGPTDVNAWMTSERESDFDQLAFPRSEFEGDWTLAYASVGYYSESIHASSRVTSALVTPERAMSLLRALESAPPREWQLPVYGSPGDGWRIDADGFQLLEWLADRRYPYSFDHLDPRAWGVPIDERKEPTSAFCETTGAVLDDEGLVWREPSGTAVARVEYWTDDPRTERTHAFHSGGCRIWVRTETLLQFLRVTGLDLIVSALINRNYSYEYVRYRDTKRRDDAERVRLYILRRDGTVETLAGRRAAGATHR